eukprot:scaffold207549_cov32-Tisochrysis_lutea.AAC.1
MDEPPSHHLKPTPGSCWTFGRLTATEALHPALRAWSPSPSRSGLCLSNAGDGQRAPRTEAKIPCPSNRFDCAWTPASGLPD